MIIKQTQLFITLMTFFYKNLLSPLSRRTLRIKRPKFKERANNLLPVENKGGASVFINIQN